MTRCGGPNAIILRKKHVERFFFWITGRSFVILYEIFMVNTPWLYQLNNPLTDSQPILVLFFHRREGKSVLNCIE